VNPLPRAVLFDNDGVLVASEPLHWTAWERLLEEHGIPYNPGEMRKYVGKTGPEIMVQLLNRYVPGWDPARYDVVALAHRKNDIYLEAARGGALSAYPGVAEGIDWLRSRGVRIGAVSNARRRELEGALRLTGLIERFDVLVSRDDVSAFKPDPTPYLFGAGALALAPGDCLAVEDSPTGLEAALLARMPSAAVTTNFPAQELSAPVPGRSDLRPVWIGESMSELFEWLKR
jgi:HAD superfamily hydrolase (TIGR01509 family)